MLNEENRTFIFNKIKREREMIPTTSTHCENRRTDGHGEDTERTRRGRTDAQRLAALRWPRFPFGEFYLIDSPPFLIPLKNASFLPFFSFLSKKHVLAVFRPLAVSNPVIDTVPVLPPCFPLRDLFPNGQFNNVC